MEESKLTKKRVFVTLNSHEFSDMVQLSNNIWKACRGGRYWILKTPRDNSSASIQLLKREYELSCRFQHPFILTPSGFEEDSPAIVMEFIEGRTLKEFISENPPLRQRRRILDQILDAVKYLHNKGVLHNDLKTENILVTSIGNNVKIIDFGFAESGADYLNRRLGGTEGATAPEVLGGDTSIRSTSSSDIYSLGGLIAQLFPGKYLHIVRRCHKTNPKRRYQDIASLEAALKRYNRLPAIGLFVVCIITAIILFYQPQIETDVPKVKEATIEVETPKQDIKSSEVVRPTGVERSKPDIKPEDSLEFKKNSLSTLRRDTMNRLERKRRDSLEKAGYDWDERTANVREQLWNIYKEYADSLDDNNLVPCQEFSFTVLSNYGKRMRAFAERRDMVSMQDVIEEEFSNGTGKLHARAMSMITLESLYLLGAISQEEKDRLTHLSASGMPYRKN